MFSTPIPTTPMIPAGFVVWKASLDSVLRTGKTDVMPVVRYSVQRPASEGCGFVEKYWKPGNYPVTDKAGKLKYIIHRTDEVTEQHITLREFEVARKKASDAESKASFALKSAEMGAWELELRTGETFRSLKHDQCFGYQSAQEIWRLEIALRHLHPDDRKMVEQAHHDVVEGKGDMGFEARVIWPDGSLHWIASRARE